MSIATCVDCLFYTVVTMARVLALLLVCPSLLFVHSYCY